MKEATQHLRGRLLWGTLEVGFRATRSRKRKLPQLLHYHTLPKRGALSRDNPFLGIIPSGLPKCVTAQGPDKKRTKGLKQEMAVTGPAAAGSLLRATSKTDRTGRGSSNTSETSEKARKYQELGCARGVSFV